MSIPRSTEKSATDRFWDRFIERITKQGVKQSQARWYVFRAEQYIKAFPGKRLAAHTVEDINGYLESLGRPNESDKPGKAAERDRITDWQFAQIVDALQNLLLMAGAASAAEVDWSFWRASARSLPSDHPTIARENSPPKAEAVSGARFNKT